MVIQFSSKARTLAALSGKIRLAKIKPFVIFTVKDWHSNPSIWVKEIIAELGAGPLIVRSSSLNEDLEGNSNAGAFLSLINIKESSLVDSVDNVISSYGQENDDDEILVQPMVENIIRSGVAFSHDPNTNSPYRVINWSEGPHSNLVTSGASGTKMWQQAANFEIKEKSEIALVSHLLNELSKIFGYVPLDIEFAINLVENKEVLWLLQVRSLLLNREPETVSVQTKRLSIIEEQVQHGMISHPFLKGRTTVYGVMPDWNPAEIIGVRPKPLALSLYRELITDSIWAYQRHNYGYRNLRSFPLMVEFFGVPYVDVRVSFNSFVPADLDEELAEKLVNHYIDRLLSQPSLHDKIEFEIVLSCFSFDFSQKLKLLEKSGFNDEERKKIANSIRNLTSKIMDPDNNLIKQDALKLKIMETRREKIFNSNLDIRGQIYWLLEDVKRYGTLPFAGLARAGFIAVQMLKSMTSTGIFSTEDYDLFFESISTVTSQMKFDRIKMDRNEFLKRYGHLRPGTYDIGSLRYDEAPDLYFDWTVSPDTAYSKKEFNLSEKQERKMADFLEVNKFSCSVDEFITFLRNGIELREFAKFEFTKNLSDMLSLINKFGEKLGFTPEDLAYSNINFFKELYISSLDKESNLEEIITLGRTNYKSTLATSLPPLITKPSDVWGFRWPESEPNFITQKKLTARVVNYTDRTLLEGSIVCIPNADPGFDWLFSHPISGLITAWGGGNSHMAIRAGELQIPSVIGAGEMLFKLWSSSEMLHVDCAERRVEVIS